MSTMYVEASAIVDARPETVYEIVADYTDGHAAILPKPYFSDMKIEKGGKGAGTVVNVVMNVWGVKRTYRFTVTEPHPGEVLTESDPEAGVTTTFTFEPVEDGPRTQVTIHTEMQSSKGIRGMMERLFTPGLTRRIYEKELAQLNAYIQQRRHSSS